jgi:hypothetical protein
MIDKVIKNDDEKMADLEAALGARGCRFVCSDCDLERGGSADIGFCKCMWKAFDQCWEWVGKSDCEVALPVQACYGIHGVDELGLSLADFDELRAARIWWPLWLAANRPGQRSITVYYTKAVEGKL